MKGLAGRLAAAFGLCFVLCLALLELVISLGLPGVGIASRGTRTEEALGRALREAGAERLRSTEAWLDACMDQVGTAASLLSDYSYRQLKSGEARHLLKAFLGNSPTMHAILLCTAREGLVLENLERDSAIKASPAATELWTRALSLKSSDGIELQLLAALDLKPLLGPQSTGGDLGSLILGPDGLPLVGEDKVDALFSRGEFASLAGEPGIHYLDSTQGGRYLALSLPAGTSLGLNLKVLAYAPESGSLVGGTRPEILACLASLVAGLLGALMAYLTIQRLAKPMGDLERAVVAFSQGNEAVELPHNSPREMHLISRAYGQLMERAKDWKSELEAEVKTRTAELSVKSAIVRALVELEADESAYQLVLGSLVSHMGGEAGLIQFIDPSRLTCVVGTRSSASLSPTRDDIQALELEAEKGSGCFSRLGYTFYYCLGRELLTPEMVQAGLILIGRNDRDFQMEEVLLLDHVLEELGPLVFARETRMRQNHIRRSAEKALRRSEERLRTFFEESHDMIYTANSDDIMASVNQAGLALLGCRDRFEAVGRPFSNFVLNLEDRSLFHERIREFGFVNDFELVIKRPDGSTVFCLETAQAVRDPKGAVIEVQGIIKDISERINNERELWKTNMELVEANLQLKKTQVLIVQQEKLASIGQLAAGVAHEINNPLGFLKSNHSVMARFAATIREAWMEASGLAPEALSGLATKHDLDYIFTEIESLLAESEEGFRRIMEIVKNLKNFARSGAEAIISPYNLNKGIESTLVVAWNEIKYVAEVDKRLGEIPDIEADGGGINQVILNLLVNSAQAIEAQGRKDKGHITIVTSLDGDRVSCVLSDDGPGIPPEIRFQIFDPFFTTKDPGKGTGLGLSISYDIIVNKHGGSITVGDNPGGGASFKILLPLVHPKAPEKKEADASLDAG